MGFKMKGFGGFKEKSSPTTYKSAPTKKTYDEAYDTRSKKYQGMDRASYIKEAKNYNREKYVERDIGTKKDGKTYTVAQSNADKPTASKEYNTMQKGLREERKAEVAAQAKKDATGVDKKRNEAYAKKNKATEKPKTTEKPKVGSVTKSEKDKGNLVVNKELMKKAEKNQRVSKATTTEKKEVGPKKEVTVKSAKASKKAGVKEAKQKGYETRKEKRQAVGGARQEGRANVKKARLSKKREKLQNKEDKKYSKSVDKKIKQSGKEAKKADKKYVKGEIKKANRASDIDKLKGKKSTVRRRNKVEDLEAKQRLYA